MPADDPTGPARRIAAVIRIPPQRGGWLEVICGPMFSGKSEEMIRRLRRAEIAGQRVVIFKPRIDDRFDAADVVSHAGARMRGVPVSSVAELEARARGFEVVGIDEVQFFELLGRRCGARARRGRRPRRRGGARPGLPAPPVRPDAGASLPRRVRRQAPGCLSSLRWAGDDDSAARRRPTRALLGRDSRRRRCGAVRGTLPRLPRARRGRFARRVSGRVGRRPPARSRTPLRRRERSSRRAEDLRSTRSSSPRARTPAR